MSNTKEKKKMRYGKKCFISLLVALLVGAGIGATYIGVKYGFKTNNKSSIFDSTVEDEIGKNDAVKNELTSEVGVVAQTDEVQTPVTSSDVSTIVANVMPSVVSINCKIVQRRNDFFGYGRNYEAQASGTGFIIGQNNNEVLIATNNHVIADASTISVSFIDGNSANAVVKGSDSYYDLAVIAVPVEEISEETAHKVRIATLGNSNNVEVGSMAIAIGNALGYGQSTTVGYISAIDREVTIDDFSMELIQTDAAINPGNSGGPLLNMNGEVIGVNSSKKTGTSVESMGYCIPISKAIPVINELMNRVELSEDEIGYLGIKGKDISSEYATSFNLPVGVYVSEVEEDSPAKLAGIHVGDVITSINGRNVSSMNELRSILSYSRAGSTITISVSTNHRGEYISRELNVVLDKRPDNMN